MFQNNRTNLKRRQVLSIGDDVYAEEYEYYIQKLNRSVELRDNAEKSLQFLLDKFRFLFEEKKYLISEIEKRNWEIIEFKITLNIK